MNSSNEVSGRAPAAHRGAPPAAAWLARCCAVLTLALAGGAYAALGAAAFNQAVADLQENAFQTRENAYQTLRTAIRDNELSSAQLGVLRGLIGTVNLETTRRAEHLLENFELGIPAVKALLREARTGWVGDEVLVDYVVAGFPVDSRKPALSEPPFSDLLKKFAEARNALLGGAVAGVEQKFDALRAAVNALTLVDLQKLELDLGDKDVMLGNLDAAIAKLAPAIATIGGGPPLAPAGVFVPGAGGAINLGGTIGLAVAGAAVPGMVSIFSPEYLYSLFRPASGYAFVGEVFDVLPDDVLDLGGAAVAVSITFGPGLATGDPIDPTRPVCLAHLDFAGMSILDCTSDPAVTALAGSYTPASRHSGALQFGEFALVQPTPEPGTFGLVLAALFLVTARRGRGAGDRATCRGSSRVGAQRCYTSFLRRGVEQSGSSSGS